MNSTTDQAQEKDEKFIHDRIETRYGHHVILVPTYQEFVDKFNQPTATTDDCYTPHYIYNAVVEWIEEQGLIQPSQRIIRPFWPGGDFTTLEYKSEDVVIDNPPFSCLSRIVNFYLEKDIKFFIFAPFLTCLNYQGIKDVCAVIIEEGIFYEGGVNVKTAFLTNLMPGVAVCASPSLDKKITQVRSKHEGWIRKPKPRYEYPKEVLRQTDIQIIAKGDEEFVIPNDEVSFIRSLDAQKTANTGIYGGGVILSPEQAQRVEEAKNKAKLIAQKRATKGAMTIEWTLSPREKELSLSLSKEALRAGKKTDGDDHQTTPTPTAIDSKQHTQHV